MTRTPEDKPTDAGDLIRFGTVASVDLGAGTCVVDIDDDAQTGDIAWIESRMGDTRIWSPPSVGEQVILLCAEGEISAAVALRGIRSDQFPLAGSTLEENITFKDGAVISYDPEGHALKALLPGGGTVEIVADGGVTIVGDVDITGTVTVSEDVIASGISLVDHLHGNVEAGIAKTGEPE